MNCVTDASGRANYGPPLIAALLVLSCGHSVAQTSASTSSRIQQSPSRSSENQVSEEQLAREWGLTAQEWSRFRELMRGPLAIYSPNLDPLTALGIEARTEAERRHFARLQVQAEARRAEKTLAYQRAYDDAWRQLYPSLVPVVANTNPPPDMAKLLVPAGEPGRLAVFVKDECPLCDRRVIELQKAGHSFDIYMVGSRQDDSRVRQWASRIGLDPAMVRDRTITLNHDAGRWLALGGKGELPAVLTMVNGQWQRE